MINVLFVVFFLVTLTLALRIRAANDLKSSGANNAISQTEIRDAVSFSSKKKKVKMCTEEELLRTFEEKPTDCDYKKCKNEDKVKVYVCK